MTEYIVKCNELTTVTPIGNKLQFPDYIDYSQEVVRCRNCKFYEPSRWYESAIFPPLGTDIEHVCTFFADGVKVEPDGFCKWGECK